jgi:tetratricopeptide (TPR) repeat protein
MALGLAFVPPAPAQNYIFENGLFGGRITEAEWKTLPTYCIDTQGFKYGRGSSPNAAKWEALLGDMFWNLHHYCLGIVEFNRAQRHFFSSTDRTGLADSAVADFQYVVRQMPTGYVLAPEIYTYLGRALLLLSKEVDAGKAFEAARLAKPDYWPAYSWWASYLADHGKVDEARAIVISGLEHAPNSQTLQDLRDRLTSK